MTHKNVRLAADSQPDAVQHVAAVVEAQVARILESDGFRRSRRLSTLLQYLVSETLSGRQARLKEYVIGTEAFGREPTFDPRLNASVRVEANRLRHRLREYFLGAGRNDPIHIDLLTGSYVPRMTDRYGRAIPIQVAAAETAPDIESVPSMTQRPSIIVLPLAYLGSNRSRFLATGVTEELVTALAATRWLRLTERHPTAHETQRDVEPREVAREGAARYLLVGSVGRAQDRLRVFVELIDVETGNLLLAHRHLERLDDAFLSQERAARTIAPVVIREIAAAERGRAARQFTEHMGAWSLYQRGLHHLYRFTRRGSQNARSDFLQAAAADPSFASPCGALAYAGFLDFVLGFADKTGDTIGDAVRAGREAVRRDERDPMAHFGLARALSQTGALAETMSELETAIELDPNFGPAYLGVGAAMSLSGRHSEAVEALDIAISLSPDDPILWTMENVRAVSHLELGQIDEAVEDGKRACRHANTVPWAYLTLVSALSNAHRDAEARDARAALVERWPGFARFPLARINPFDIAVTPIWHRGVRKAWRD